MSREDTEARNEMLLAHYEMAEAIARGMYGELPKVMDVDDLISSAVMGLIDAIDRFDESRGVPFAAYAKFRIRGAIIDAVRASDWTPTSVRRKATRLERSKRHLRDRLGRKPTRDEIQQSIGLDDRQMDRMERDSHIRPVLSLDQPAIEDGSPLSELVGDDSASFVEDLAHEETLLQMREALGALPERDRQAVELYYFGEMKLREVGEVMGISESRVCQLCKRAIRRMRSSMELGRAVA